MSDYYSIQEVGGTELARHYPDRGPIAEAHLHKAVLTAGTKATGWRRLFRKSERFIAVISANAEGLRFSVALDDFAVFIPWSEITADGERSTPATVVRVRTAALPEMELEFHLDDVAADAIFTRVMPLLPLRYPPGRLAWPKPGAVFGLVAVTIVLAVVLNFLNLSTSGQLAATLGIAIVMAVVWYYCGPLIEESQSS